MLLPQTTAAARARHLFAAIFLLLLAGCGSLGFPGVYRINVEQGNIITQEMVDQLKPGMTRRQVRFVLGTPLLEDPFHSDRWEYIYMVRNGNRTLVEQRLTVYFEGDALTHFTSTIPPSDAAAALDAGETTAGTATAGGS